MQYIILFRIMLQIILAHVQMLRYLYRLILIGMTRFMRCNQSSGVFRISKRGGGKFSLDTSAHIKGGGPNQAFQFFYYVKKISCQSGPCPPPKYASESINQCPVSLWIAGMPMRSAGIAVDTRIWRGSSFRQDWTVSSAISSNRTSNFASDDRHYNILQDFVIVFHVFYLTRTQYYNIIIYN